MAQMAALTKGGVGGRWSIVGEMYDAFSLANVGDEVLLALLLCGSVDSVASSNGMSLSWMDERGGSSLR